MLDWLRLARHQAVDSYLPDSDTVRDSCLDDVCASDLYLLILGHRYGFQPSNDNPEDLSITQLEFRRAGECGIPRVALLRTSIPDVGLSDLQDPQRLVLVTAFRAEVTRQVRPAEFSDLNGLIQGLSTGIQGELDKLDRQEKRLTGQVTAGRVLRLAPRQVFLAGREELLAELDARLAGDEAAGPRVVALTGLGGAGKTSVAVEYAHRHLGELGMVWQFGAEDPAVLAAGFGELAAQLGVWDGGDPLAAVHGALAASSAGWLLVFDNAPDQASIARFVPPAGLGRVLITSRNQIWPPGQALDVPVLDPQVAAEFLVNRTGDADQRAALDLADMLGGLPLALEQAAAYVQATGNTLAGYLAMFRQRRPELLGRGEPTGYPGTVATTWILAFDDVQRAAPDAAGLLRLLAFCAPEAIPLRLLLQPRPGLADRLGEQVAPVLGPLLEDELTAGDAIGALRRYSLVTPVGGGSVSVQRLVQAVTADQMSTELTSQWRQAAAAVIEAALPADLEDPATWPAFAALLPHAQTALDPASDGMYTIARYLGVAGNYAAARDLQQQVLEARETDLGPEHPRTLIARDNLSFWTGRAGDAAAARDQYAALLPDMERVLGPEHPGTLTARDNLASWTGEAGDAAAARDQYAALLPDMERVLGPEHPGTLTARDNLASWTGEAGDAAAARDQYAALLPDMERVLGPEHPGTLTARDNLARWTGEAGDAVAARDQYAALLPVMERVQGPEHPHTLTTRANLARWTGEAGDAAAARDQYAVLRPVMKRVQGPEHPHTLTTRANLARWTGEAGDAAAARDQYAALLPDMEQVLGPEHPGTLTARDNLARWTGEAGDAAAARDQYAALLPVMERVQGPEHPHTLTTRANLARWTGEAGDAAAARDQYAVLRPVMKRVQGPEHPHTLTTRANLARWTGEAGDAAAARDQYAALLPDMEQVLGPENIETLRVRVGAARWTGEAGDPAGARNLLIALLPDMERVLGAEQPDTLTVALGETLTSGNVLLVGGPEIPVARHAPGRMELLRSLVEGASDQSIDKADRSQVLASLARGNLDEVARILRAGQDGLEAQVAERYAARPAVSAYDLLARIAFTGVINMSWDSSLLDAFRLRSPVVISGSSEEVLTAAKSQQFAFTWFAGDPNHEQIAIGPKEVRARLLANETLSRFLTGSVQSSSLIFVGVRASDVIDFFDTFPVSGIGMSSATTPSPRRFAVCAIGELWELNRSQLRDNLGVELIGYDPADAGALARILQRLLDVSRPYAVQDGMPTQSRPLGQVLSRVTLVNIGAFERLDLELGQAWNVLLGINGCGKTTFLRAVALGLCGDHPLALEAGAGLLRTGCDQGLIELQVGSSRFRTELHRTPDAVRVRSNSLSPLERGNWVVLGFPALRGMSLAAPSGISRPQAPEPRVEDLLPLLRNQVDARLDDIKQWIINVEARARRTEDERARQMLGRFFDLLGELTPGIMLEFEAVDQTSWEVWVRTDDGVVSIDQLSQGMSSIVAWVGTLLQRMYDIYEDSDEPAAEPAFVLIDELDAHLHPAWQRLLPSLTRNHFPRVQFLATSHSPLVAGSLRPGELFVAERAPADSRDDSERLVATVAAADMNPEGLRANQVLTSSLFGLDSTRDEGTKQLMKEYANLLGKPEPTEEQRARLQELSQLLEDIVPSYAETEAARRAEQLVEEWLLERISDLSSDEQGQVLAEARMFLARLHSGGS